MLVQVMERGSGRGGARRFLRRSSSRGKTGTSSDYRDSWFAGFSGNTLAVVWIGYDRQFADRADRLVGLAAGLVAADALHRNNVVERAIA